MAIEEIRRTLDHLAETAQTADTGRFHKLLETSRAEVREYLMSIELEGTTPAFTASYVGDALQRFLHTLSFVPLPAGRRILELGGNPYFFHILLRRIFPGSSVEAANFFDHNIFSGEIGSATHHLRSRMLGEEWAFTYPSFNLEVVPRYPLPPASFDLIFFCETLEHLVVNPLAVFRKIRRLLAPGGNLIITLPNAVRLTNLALMLDGYNFFDIYHPDNGIHGRHNREFTLDEMKNLLALNGLAVRRAETKDRFDYDQVPILGLDYSGKPVSLTRRHRDLVKILHKAGGRLDDRGDNLYLLAQRPPQASQRAAQAAPRQETGLAPCPPPPPPSERVSAYMDGLRDEAGSLYVRGWAFLSDEWGGEDEWVRLVLRSAKRCFSVACSREWRKDVADQFGLDRDDPGFEVSLDKSALPPGKYRLGLLLGGPGLQEGFHDLGADVLAG